MDRNLKGLNKTIANLKHKGKKKGVDVETIAPRGYGKLSENKQRKIIAQLQNAIFGKTYPVSSSYVDSKKKQPIIKERKSKLSPNYREFLKKSGLHDSTQARQIFKDIKDYTKQARNIKRNLSDISKNLDKDAAKELENMVKNKATIKDFLNNTPGPMLRYSPYSKVQELQEKYSSKYIDEIIKRKSCGLTDKEYKQIIKKFNSLPIYKKIGFNLTLYEKYYDEYLTSKTFGEEYSANKIINKLLSEV